jgi:glycoprotein 6-alpha-L-fucosyltransferase
LYNLSTTDSLGEWRKREAIQLTNKVQKDFESLQNPKNCDDQRKIICDLNKACGFGCQVHHVMFCFITSYFNNRTMILESGNWRYNSRGFEAYFKPLSETCKSSKDIIVDWSGKLLFILVGHSKN